jgi:hypothetical protein
MTSETNPTCDVKADRGKHEETKDRLINLDAKPEAITLDPARTAVIARSSHAASLLSVERAFWVSDSERILKAVQRAI